MGIPDPLIPKDKLEELLRGMSYRQGRSPLPNYNLLVISFYNNILKYFYLLN